jgi:hypothetical protein
MKINVNAKLGSGSLPTFGQTGETATEFGWTGENCCKSCPEGFNFMLSKHNRRNVSAERCVMSDAVGRALWVVYNVAEFDK